MGFRLTVTVFAVSALVAGSVGLAGSAAAADKDGFSLSVYGSLPTMYGKINTDEGSTDRAIGAGNDWNNPSWNYSALAIARMKADKLVLQLSGEYFDLSGESQSDTVRPGPSGNPRVQANVQPEVQAWFADATVGYQLLNEEKAVLMPKAEIYAGARYTWFHPDFNASGGVSGSLDEKQSWFDPIVGTRIGLGLSKTVELTIAGDVGGFGLWNSSDFAWMSMTGMSWAFADNAAVNFAYKFQQFRRVVGDNHIREQFRGPYAGVTLAF